MSKHKGIANYLKYICERYNLEICVNDFAGFLYIDKELAVALQPYLIHKTPFCMQIKSDKRLWNRCLQMKRGILLKCEKNKETFYGMCYCGVEEYIVPVICNNLVIGAICVGEFSTHKGISMYRISKILRQYSMETGTLKANFNYSTLNDKYDIELINSLFGIIAEYLSNIYATLISTHKDLSLKNSRSYPLEHYFLSHVIEYIKNNYQSQITVKGIAGFCHCSESYINHIFKKNMKINIKAYINKIRVEQAKTYLINSGDNIAEISSKVGFGDPNYFSNVFSKIYSITPTEFRKRFSAKG